MKNKVKEKWASISLSLPFSRAEIVHTVWNMLALVEKGRVAVVTGVKGYKVDVGMVILVELTQLADEAVHERMERLFVETVGMRPEEGGLGLSRLRRRELIPLDHETFGVIAFGGGRHRNHGPVSSFEMHHDFHKVKSVG